MDISTIWTMISLTLPAFPWLWSQSTQAVEYYYLFVSETVQNWNKSNAKVLKRLRYNMKVLLDSIPLNCHNLLGLHPQTTHRLKLEPQWKTKLWPKVSLWEWYWCWACEVLILSWKVLLYAVTLCYWHLVKWRLQSFVCFSYHTVYTAEAK